MNDHRLKPGLIRVKANAFRPFFKTKGFRVQPVGTARIHHGDGFRAPPCSPGTKYITAEHKPQPIILRYRQTYLSLPHVTHRCTGGRRRVIGGVQLLAGVSHGKLPPGVPLRLAPPTFPLHLSSLPRSDNLLSSLCHLTPPSLSFLPPHYLSFCFFSASIPPLALALLLLLLIIGAQQHSSCEQRKAGVEARRRSRRVSSAEFLSDVPRRRSDVTRGITEIMTPFVWGGDCQEATPGFRL